MISVVIPTHESEHQLVHTLAALVPGALAGVVREVIVADAGSMDATDKVADIAGCHFLVANASLGARLAQAAQSARAPWLMFLQPGSVPDGGWIEEIESFVRAAALAGQVRAAVFRRRPAGGRSSLGEAMTLIASAFGARSKAGLLIAKSLYDDLGAHDGRAADPETDLLRRLGRRRVAVLRCGITQAG